MNSEKKWYALYTRVRWEKKVAALLTKKNIENYCPQTKVEKQWADRKKVILEPLFTSYVFVRVATIDHSFLRNTDGVVNIVYWLNKPAIIENAEIDTIKQFLDEYTNVSVSKAHVNINDTVKIVSGALTDQVGRVVAVSNTTVKVSLPSLGFIMSAELPVRKVQAIIDPRNSYDRQTAKLKFG
jgi:transcription antitermination factor NusG